MYISPEVKHKIHHTIGGIIIAFGAFGIFYSVQAYPKIFQVDAVVSAKENIDPKQSVQIKFSEPMITNQTAQSVKISPEMKVALHWEGGNKILVIAPETFWQPESEYKISINGGKSIMYTEVSTELAFKVTGYPKITEFYPAQGEKDVMLDIEDPIIATFDKPLDNFRAKFVIRPYQELIFDKEITSSKVRLLAKNELTRGQKYEIEVWMRYKEESETAYNKIYTTSFETKPLPPTTWEKDFTLRLDQAKRLTEAKILTGKYIDINVKSQVMTIFEDGKLLDAFLISSGKAGMPTPQGTFHIANKTPRAWSKRYGLFMPYWNALVPSGDFGIHELPEWPGGYKEGQNHLGTPVSHGCVRLGVGPAERVYNWAPIGTAVVVHE
jgi:lipoprotein-anchoring transpeptidase ErfK/SrfK